MHVHIIVVLNLSTMRMYVYCSNNSVRVDTTLLLCVSKDTASHGNYLE